MKSNFAAFKIGLIALSAMLVLIFCGVESCQTTRPDVAEDLIDAFASGCSSHGQWTNIALGHTNSIINVLNKIKTSGPCKSLNDDLSQIKALDSQLKFLLNNTDYIAYRSSQENIQELTLALQDPKLDPGLRTALATALTTEQVQFTSLKSKGVTQSFLNASATMGSTMRSLVAQAGDMSYCFQESPASALKLATNAMAVGGSFITPVIGAGIGALGALLNGVIDYTRNHATNEALWNAYSSKMPLALTCGLETMTKLYCQASDALELIEFQKSNYPENGAPPNSFWTGMDILNRRLPVLTKWLFQVKTGVSPSDSTEAQKQIQIWQKIQNLENTDISVVGGLNGTIQLYKSKNTSEADKLNLLTNAIVGFANGVAPNCSMGMTCSGPLSSFASTTYYYTCWLVDGYRDVSKGTDPNCPLYKQSDESIEQYVRKNLVGHANIDLLESNWKSIFKAAKALADIEFAQTITLNPAELLRQAYFHDQDNVSPHDVLVMLRDYVKYLLNSDMAKNPNDVPVMTKTLSQINKTLEIIEDRWHPQNSKPAPSEPSNDDSMAMSRVRELIEQLDLKHSARAFLQVVSELALTDIQNHLDRGELPTNISEILKTAGVDIRTALSASGVEYLGVVTNDINNSRNQTEDNITNFRKYFGPSLIRAIQKLDEMAHPPGQKGEPEFGVNRPHSQTLAKLCMLTISTGYEWPDKKTEQICLRQTLSSLYSKSNSEEDPLTVKLKTLNEHLKGHSLQERFCTYHKYASAERLAEILNLSRRQARWRTSHENIVDEDILRTWHPRWTWGIMSL